MSDKNHNISILNLLLLFNNLTPSKMKTTILKHRFLYIFILLSLTISFNSCSDDDEPQTFLEKYDGTKWFSDDDDDLYIRIIDNTSVIFEQWFLGHDCYYYYTLGDNDSVEIIENSKDKLVLRLTYDETVTVTVEGDIMKFIVTEVDGFHTIFFTKTLMNVDDLQICSIEPHSFNFLRKKKFIIP